MVPGPLLLAEKRNLLVLATNKERRRPSVRVCRWLVFFGHGRSLLWCVTSHRRTDPSFPTPPPTPRTRSLKNTFTQSLCLVEFGHNSTLKRRLPSIKLKLCSCLNKRAARIAQQWVAELLAMTATEVSSTIAGTHTNSCSTKLNFP